ncbi:hypothetical protein BH20ACI4_BH20ACI4_31800 [soil metagenome]
MLELSVRESRREAKEKIMNTDEMKDEYDFSTGKRGIMSGLLGKKKSERKEPVDTLAVCVKAEDFMNLIPRKIYNVKNYDNELIKLTDETGEEVVYPIRYFLVLTLSTEVENIIENIAA